MKQHIPNSITLLNLFCGCCAIIAILNDQVVLSLILLFAGLVADYLDGAAARILNVHSPLGKELDSLADMVTFGLLPGSILYYILSSGQPPAGYIAGVIWQYTPVFIITLFSALRLAKFNLDTRQTDYFLGLPTPSSTIFVAGLLAIYHYDSLGLGEVVSQPWLLFIVAAGLSYLLVSEVPMFNLKFKHFRWSGNEIKFIFAGVAVALLALLGVAGPSSVILLYILFNLGRYLSGYEPI
ncbi:MAG: CDP-alcohol phosphatidyltransferase family protein [Saprospiraceae bacterium]